MMESPALLATILHQINPFVIEVVDGVGIRWYGLAYIGGALIAFVLIRGLARRGRAAIAPELVFDFALYSLIGAFVGGRLGFCLLYKPQLLGLVDGFPFWGVLALQEGGMASHGGIVGMLIAIVHFARRHRLDAWHLLDLACLTGPIGLFLGRIANFINGELYGRPCSPNLSWGVKFAKEIFAWDTMDLARLAPAAQIVGTPQREWLAMLDNPQEHQPQIAGILNAITVGIEDNVRPVVAAVEPILTPRYPSQLIQAGLEGLLVLFLLALIWTRPRKPGVVAGWFVVLYAVARIAGEQFRMPDTDIGFELFGLTRGQELSILMLLVGVGVVLLAVYRQADKRPGWIGPMTDSSAKKLDRDQAHVVS